MEINAISLNCRGLGDTSKRRSVFNWIQKHPRGPYEVIFLQETHSTTENMKYFKDNWSTYHKNDEILFSHGTSSSKGVLTIIHSKLVQYIQNTNIDQDGRYTIVDMDINGTSYCFLNIYAPNLENQNEQLIFWNKVKLILYDRQGSNVIIGGDLNMFLDGQLDKSPQNTKLYRAIEEFKQTMDDYNLVDICTLYITLHL